MLELTEKHHVCARTQYFLLDERVRFFFCDTNKLCPRETGSTLSNMEVVLNKCPWKRIKTVHEQRVGVGTVGTGSETIVLIVGTVGTVGTVKKKLNNLLFAVPIVPTVPTCLTVVPTLVPTVPTKYTNALIF